MLTFRDRRSLCVSLMVLCCGFAKVVPAQNSKLSPVPDVADQTAKPVSPATLPAIRAFEHYAAYWTSEAGWDTELRLKNNFPSAPLTVTPVLRLASGQEVPLPSVIIAPNASISLSVNEALQENAPSLLGQANSYGSVIFRFNSKSSMSLYATAVPALQGAPVAFPMNAHLSGPTFTLGNNGPGSLEGIWWRARSGLKDVLVIGNSSDVAVNGTLSLFDAGGKQWTAPLSLGPRQVQRMIMSDLVREAGLTGSYGGISFAVPSAASAIDGVHFMYDEGGKFSASLEMFRRDPNATVSNRLGADQKQWTMRAPMLALTNPDPELGLSLSKSLQPTILLRNTTPNNVSAEITLNWRGGSVGKGQVKLPELQLPAFATKEVQIWAMQKRLGIPDDAHWALVSLTTNAASDDLIAIASSRDCTGEYNVETKFVGGLGGNYLAGGEWRTDATHNQIAAITNVGTQPTDALLTLHYNNGVSMYELQQTIPPGDQMWVNLSQLVRQGLPDRNGNILPAGTNAVTYDLQDLTPGGHSLMANNLAVNMASGQAVPDCPYCCGYDSSYPSPDPIEIALGFFSVVSIDALNGCSGIPNTVTYDFTDWTSSNASIAQVTTGKASGVGVGSATGFIEGTVDGPGECACNPHIVEISVPINVGTLVCSPSPVTRGSSVSCAVNNAPSGASYSNWKFTDSNNNTVARSGTAASWSGTAVTSGTVSVTVSAGGISSPLPAGITVTNRSGFALSALATTMEPSTFSISGCSLAVPSPPQAGLELGASCDAILYSYQTTPVNDNGPNQGYQYVTSVSYANSAGYYYAAVPDILNPSSAFSLAQCGNYNATSNPNGLISQPNLKSNIIRHESGPINSHYAQYVSAQNNLANNLGTVGEQVIGAPSDTNFSATVKNALDAKVATIGSLMESPEPCGGEYNGSVSPCVFQGNIKYMPYALCP